MTSGPTLYTVDFHHYPIWFANTVIRVGKRRRNFEIGVSATSVYERWSSLWFPTDSSQTAADAKAAMTATGRANPAAAALFSPGLHSISRTQGSAMQSMKHKKNNIFPSISLAPL